MMKEKIWSLAARLITSGPLPIEIACELGCAILAPLGLCLGIDDQRLGISRNSTIEPANIDHIKSLLAPPAEEKKKKAKPQAA